MLTSVRKTSKQILNTTSKISLRPMCWLDESNYDCDSVKTAKVEKANILFYRTSQTLSVIVQSTSHEMKKNTNAL